MALDKRELFERIRALWPPTVDPSALSSLYDVIDETTSRDDHWREVGAWSFHQALFAFAKTRPGAKNAPINTDVVTFENFDHFVRSNLQDASWANERQEYEAS